jgi:glycosyltransferase involved in cell wall biosynthesis
MKLSIIITCFNHANFIKESIQSAIDQSIEEKEIFVTDNGSQDNSLEQILQFQKSNPEIQFVFKTSPENYCKTFNEAFHKSKGQFIIDLSGDDILDSNFAEKSIALLEKQEKDFGVSFSNTEKIDEKGKSFAYHFPINSDTKLAIKPPPSGDIYKDLLERYIISAPSMLTKRQVLLDLGAYDEDLNYEDFDFWIRSSRKWKYIYLDEPLVKVRSHQSNFGKAFSNKRQNDLMWSTFKVCLKAKYLNKTEEENSALHKRCSYHLRNSVFTEHFRLAKKYYALINSVGKANIIDRLFLLLAVLQLPVHPFYRMYIKDH